MSSNAPTVLLGWRKGERLKRRRLCRKDKGKGE